MYFSFLLPLNGQKIFHANDNYPANIRLDEDVLKMSFVFVFKRRLQDVLMKTNIFFLITVFRRRLQDVLAKTNIFVLFKRLYDVFKASSRRLQGVFKIFSRRLQDVFKISSKRLQEVSQIRLEDIFKTF